MSLTFIALITKRICYPRLSYNDKMGFIYQYLKAVINYVMQPDSRLLSVNLFYILIKKKQVLALT